MDLLHSNSPTMRIPVVDLKTVMATDRELVGCIVALD